MRILAAPGQGSQKPGFLEPWLADESAKDSLAHWSDLTGIDLVAHGTTSDADTIRDTRIAQPLIVAAGLLTGRRVLAALGDSPVHLAGHSVGEITAAALAGVFSDDEAMTFVAARGRAMADAAALTPTGMSAVVGAGYDAIAPVLEGMNLRPANVNSDSQVVAAGLLSDLAALKDNPPEGTRVIPLDVAGAFHTDFMSSAQEPLRAIASTMSPQNPMRPLHTNRDGSVVESGVEFLELLVGQVVSPVRWDLCMQSFEASGASEFIELAPAGALVGLAKRALTGVECRKIDLPEHIDELS